VGCSHRQSDCIVLDEPFVYLHKVVNPHLQVVKYAGPHCLEKVGLGEVAYNPGKMSKQVEFSVNMVQSEFGIGYNCVGIAERSIYVVILPGVLLVRRDIISRLVLWTLAPKTDMPLEMM
jgi:hypothetical protein